MTTDIEKSKALNVGDFESSYYASSSERKQKNLRKMSKRKKISDVYNEKENKSSIDTQTEAYASNSLTSNHSSFHFDNGSNFVNDFNLIDNRFNAPGIHYHEHDHSTVSNLNFNNINQQTKFMENLVNFYTLPGYKKEELKVQVIKNQVQIRAERDPIKGFDTYDLDTIKDEVAMSFDEETHDGKKTSVTFLNGILRVEIPLREDISTDIDIQ